jgi:hypothetical protein
MQHSQLPDAGITPHFDIDNRLPTHDEKAALSGRQSFPSNVLIAPGQSVVLLASGNALAEQDGNWRLIVDSGELLIQARLAGTWTTQARFTTD